MSEYRNDPTIDFLLDEGSKDSEDYANRYDQHIHAMTAERLNSKSDIAWELTIRDQRIAELEEQNKWISVDERLPEEGQFCLFYYGIIDGEPEMDADFWEESSMTMGYSWQRNVTHWKPITPPEKDDE